MGKTSSISAGRSHTLLIDSSGGLQAFGDNNNGQLGDGTTTGKRSPIQIKQETKFTQISAGSGHSLSIDSEGKVYGAGNAYYLGDPSLLILEPKIIN